MGSNTQAGRRQGEAARGPVRHPPRHMDDRPFPQGDFHQGQGYHRPQPGDFQDGHPHQRRPRQHPHQREMQHPRGGGQEAYGPGSYGAGYDSFEREGEFGMREYDQRGEAFRQGPQRMQEAGYDGGRPAGGYEFDPMRGARRRPLPPRAHTLASRRDTI